MVENRVDSIATKNKKEAKASFLFFKNMLSNPFYYRICYTFILSVKQNCLCFRSGYEEKTINFQFVYDPFSGLCIITVRCLYL